MRSNHFIHRNLDAANETMANLKSAGFKPNMFTFDEFLRHYAKTGDLDGVEQTISRMKEENIELMNRDILKVIREVAANGHAEQVDSLLELIKPTIELRQSLRNAIEIFVDKRLSPIVPKILERAGGDVNEKVKHLIEKMVRSSTPEAEFKATIGAIEGLYTQNYLFFHHKHFPIHLIAFKFFSAMGITIESNFDLFKPALDGPSADIIRRLLNHMQEKSIPATENVFEKLFRLAAEKDANEVLGVVNLMSKEFKIQPQVTFVRDVILPGLKCKESPALALAKLQGTSIRPRIALLAIVTDCLIKKNIKMAYEFANTNFRAFYGIDLVRRPLLEAFAATGDIENFVLFVRHVHDSFKELNNYHNSTTDQNATPLTETQIQTKQKAYIEELLWAAIANRRNEAQLVTQLLKSFATEGLTISPAQAEKLQKYLQVEGDTEIGRLLTKLSTESLPLRPIEVKRYQPSAMNKLSSNEIQNILEVKLAQGHSAAATEKMLFLAYVREGNAAEIESILAKDKISLSNSDYAQLIDLYTRHNNLENALNILKRVCANNSSFKLDPIKVAKLVRLMIDKERNFDEIDALLLAHRQGKAEHRIFIFEHLLDQLAENGCFKLIEQLFDSLIEYQYIEPTPQSTGPLIKAYCVKGKYTEAVTKFEHFASTHKLVPMTMVLFVQLIKNNQVESLQRAFDAVEQLHGERNALYRLAFAFIECGQDRQARAIFENDRLDNITPAIVRECKTFVKFDRIEPLMVLLKATKGLFCNRHVIYQSLLDVYTKKNNASEALELWCEYLTDDGILPVLRFKKGLISLLKANDMPIPPELTENDKTSENAKPSDETFTKQTILN